ncbi:hypothetical protein FKP32DRAFT_1530130, partial [Trametes sanguinea]
PPPARRMTTRARNQHTHPGIPDLPGYRADEPDRVPTPPAERRRLAAATKDEAARLKARQAHRQADGVKRAAEIEARVLQEDSRAAAERRRPSKP